MSEQHYDWQGGHWRDECLFLPTDAPYGAGDPQWNDYASHWNSWAVGGCAFASACWSEEQWNNRQRSEHDVSTPTTPTQSTEPRLEKPESPNTISALSGTETPSGPDTAPPGADEQMVDEEQLTPTERPQDAVKTDWAPYDAAAEYESPSQQWDWTAMNHIPHTTDGITYEGVDFDADSRWYSQCSTTAEWYPQCSTMSACATPEFDSSTADGRSAGVRVVDTLTSTPMRTRKLKKGKRGKKEKEEDEKVEDQVEESSTESDDCVRADAEFKYENAHQVHFQKTYATMGEIIARYQDVFERLPDNFSFLDLGCAPGGFVHRMLEVPRCKNGFGVTLPNHQGGYRFLLTEVETFFLQEADLFDLANASDVISPDTHVVVFDAQDLSLQRKACGRAQARRGSGALRIWALTMKEVAIGLEKLLQDGVLIFRFGVRGFTEETDWYTESSLDFLLCIMDLFANVEFFKSEYFHQADPTVYCICEGFDKMQWNERSMEQTFLKLSSDILLATEEEQLPALTTILPCRTGRDRSDVVFDMFRRVGKIREIARSGRTKQQKEKGLEASLFFSPVMTSRHDVVRKLLSHYGKIVSIHFKQHVIGVGADLVVQFALKSHAEAAMQAAKHWELFGTHVGVSFLQDELHRREKAKKIVDEKNQKKIE
eukprot:GEMP01029891.1.p1 GENE.GEMP01029891.1~~GEMP01029891.1.p1  ORF type:complete len:656 (+),score=149.94 GEMP01029891.1:257-2224(+)